MNYATVFCSRLNCWSRARFIHLYTVSTEILIQKVRSTVSATPPCPSRGRRDKRGWARWACSAQPFWKTAKVDIELLDYCTCLRFLQRVILRNLENLLANCQFANKFEIGKISTHFLAAKTSNAESTTMLLWKMTSLQCQLDPSPCPNHVRALRGWRAELSATIR